MEIISKESFLKTNIMDKESLFIRMEDINKGNGGIACWKVKG